MTSKLTREELLNIIETDHVQCGEASALARIALAVMDSEPVADVVAWSHPTEERTCDIRWRRHDVEPGPLYRHAQPAPVVQDIDELRLAFEAAERESCNGFNLHKYGIGYADDKTQWRWDTWLACRAAMLQAGTLTNEDTKQAWTGIPDIDNAINMLDRIDTLESCDDDRIEAVKTVLRRLAGNSPAIPDGYVMVPKEPTEEMNKAGWVAMNEHDAINPTYRAMLAAAPAGIPMNSTKWIPVSERMPETDGNYWGWWSESKRQGPVWFIKSELQAQFQSSEITHWMPLPAAPQEVNHG